MGKRRRKSTNPGARPKGQHKPSKRERTLEYQRKLNADARRSPGMHVSAHGDSSIEAPRHAPALPPGVEAESGVSAHGVAKQPVEGVESAAAKTSLEQIKGRYMLMTAVVVAVIGAWASLKVTDREKSAEATSTTIEVNHKTDSDARARFYSARHALATAGKDDVVDHHLSDIYEAAQRNVDFARIAVDEVASYLRRCSPIGLDRTGADGLPPGARAAFEKLVKIRSEQLDRDQRGHREVVVLSNADLRGLDITRLGGPVDMSHFDFRGSDLRGARLELSGPVRSSQPENQRGVVLTASRLNGAQLDGAYLAFANLTDADLKNVTFRSVRLTGARFTDAVLTGAHFEQCDLGAAVFDGSVRLDGAVFRDSTALNKAVFGSQSPSKSGRLELSGVKFTDCVLREVRFDSCTLTRCEFQSCTIVDSTLKSSDFQTLDISGTEFLRTQFAAEHRDQLRGTHEGQLDAVIFG